MTIKKLKAKSVITCVSVVLCLAVTSVLLLGFVFPKQITIVDSGSEIKVMTLEKTVEEILTEKGIALADGDLVFPDRDSAVKDGGTITISRLKKITFLADGSTVTINTTAEKAPQAVLDAGIYFGEFDDFSCGKDAQLKDGMTIEIIRAKAVKVIIDGQPYDKYTSKPTVKDFLAEAYITLGKDDEVTPALETPVTEGLNIIVARLIEGNETYEEAVSRNVVKKQSSDYIQGQTIVNQEGADGVAKNTYHVVRKNGVVISKTLLNSETIVAPVDQIITVGTKIPTIASAGDVKYKKVIQCTATAYEPGYPGITATGRKAGPGIIAVDPKVIPLGTKVYVESTDDGKSWTYGYAIAADTGGAIKGNKVDLCYNTASECFQFGRRQCNVYILE